MGRGRRNASMKGGVELAARIMLRIQGRRGDGQQDLEAVAWSWFGLDDQGCRKVSRRRMTGSGCWLQGLVSALG